MCMYVCMYANMCVGISLRGPRRRRATRRVLPNQWGLDRKTQTHRGHHRIAAGPPPGARVWWTAAERVAAAATAFLHCCVINRITLMHLITRITLSRRCLTTQILAAVGFHYFYSSLLLKTGRMHAVFNCGGKGALPTAQVLIHTYIRTYIHTYIHTNIHTDIHT
jgi:hypothetical protein